MKNCNVFGVSVAILAITPVVVYLAALLWKLYYKFFVWVLPNVSFESRLCQDIFAWIAFAISLILLFCYWSSECEEKKEVSGKDVDKTGHLCDICQNPMKVGEGIHDKDGSGVWKCYCVCDRCLPTTNYSKVK